MNEFKKILVLAPHTDDGEIGCGGTIVRLLEEGKQVYYSINQDMVVECCGMLVAKLDADAACKEGLAESPATRTRSAS